MSPVRMAQAEAAARAALALNAAWHARDIAALAALLADGCVLESADPAPVGTRLVGRAAVVAHWQAQLAGDPAPRALEDLTGLGERCVMRWRALPNGVRGVDLLRVDRAGLIVELLVYVKG